MSAFILKIIALITMFTDHVGYVLFGKATWFNYIGRIAFPIFAFQISEGYIHTKNIYKYMFRLFLFAIISQIPFTLFQYSVEVNCTLNVFFTLLSGLISIYIYDKIKYKSLGVLCAIILGAIAEYLKFDYGAFGIAIIFLFYLFKDKKILMSISFIIAVSAKYLYRILKYGFRIKFIIYALCTMLPIIFILLYNNKKGRNIKYLLYFFYPIHLLILASISLFLK